MGWRGGVGGDRSAVRIRVVRFKMKMNQINRIMKF